MNPDPGVMPPEWLQFALDLSPAGMLIVDAEGRIVRANREIERIFGYPDGELIGEALERLVPARFREAHVAHRHRFAASPSRRALGAGRDLAGLRKDGAEVPVEIALNPLVTKGGGYVVVSVIDIEERVRAERALRESEERFRVLIDGVPDFAIFMLDPGGRVMSWNAGAQRMHRRPAEEAIGMHVGRFLDDGEEAQARFAAALRRAAADGRMEEESWRRRSDGTRFLAHVTLSALRDQDRRLRGFACVTRDITAKRQLEHDLRHAQKLEAVGTLAGGIAHDFNNVLTAIAGYSELAAANAADPGVKADLAQVIRAADRGRQLVARILLFTRERETIRVVLRLESVLDEALELLRATIPGTVEVRREVRADLPAVLADGTQMHQVIVNLVTNAVQAFRGRGGRIEVRLEPILVDEHMTVRHPELKPGRHVRLRVRDDGPGMEPEIAERATEPFFTTRPSGTGLGLSVVQGIVSEHRGALQLDSVAGRGTTVDVILPSVELEAQVTVVRPSEPLPGARPLHILYIDDEPALVDLAKRQLARLGYQVSGFASAATALEVFRGTPDAFDLVITDHNMPHLSGLTFARKICAMRPGLPILMLTGYGDTLSEEALQIAGIRKVLTKPPIGRELAAAIEALTDAARLRAPEP